MAESLSRRGHEIHVVTYPYGSGEVAPEILVHRASRTGTRYRALPGPSLDKLTLLDPRLVRVLRRLLHSTPIDVVYAHHYEGLLVGAVARAGVDVPLVYDAHTLLAFELPEYGPRLPVRLKGGVGRALDRWLPTRADHVISVSSTIRDWLLESTRLGPEDVTVISNGVSAGLFPVPGPDDVLGGGRIVVFTGNLAAYQGIERLLRAFRIVVDQRPDARLRIVTESSFTAYEDLARSLGIRSSIDVVTSGFDGVPALLASADVAVNPRLNCTGIPLKLLNYMAASKPVVSFRSSAPGVEHGRTGWLAEDGDVEGFAHGILTLLGDRARARSMGAAARSFVEAEHTWSRMAEAAEEVFLSLLDPSVADVPADGLSALEIGRSSDDISSPTMRSGT